MDLFGPGRHCFFHPNERAPREGDYLVCFECGHVYETADDLRREEASALNDLNRFLELTPRHVVDPAKVDLSTVHSCPLCTHDW